MNYKHQIEPQLKLFGVDRVIAVLKNATIEHKQLSGWTRKQLATSIFQSKMDFNFSFVKKQLNRDLSESKIYNDRTVIISDDPQVISKLKDKKLAMILGLDHQEKEQVRLYESGADVVIDSLQSIDFVTGNASNTSFTQTLPSAFYELSTIKPGLNHRKPLFFFDYDGTLAPINKDPAKAYIPDQTRNLLEQLAGKFRVAIVSGRDMDDLKGFIGLDSLIYAGSHGFRISGPGNIQMQHKKTSNLLPQLDELTDRLLKEPELEIKGIEIERKHLAIAIHYRNAAPGSYRTVLRIAKGLVASLDDFQIGRGKKIIEIRPSMQWHKGKAVNWITERLESSDRQQYLPIYLGDDLTDEDAFRSLPKHGIGILVGEHNKPSAAQCQLDDIWEVQRMLHFLVHTW